MIFRSFFPVSSLVCRALPFILLLTSVRHSNGQAVPTFAGNPQHTGNYQPAAVNLNKILWSSSIDLNNSGAFTHYGAPLVTAANTVIVPVKTATNGFEVHGFAGSTGAATYTLASDYILPSYDWIPVYQPVLATSTLGLRLYFAGAGGTIYYISNPDSATPGLAIQLAFYGLSSYASNKSAFDSSVFINTPLTADSSGNIFFGFRVQGNAPAPLNTSKSGFARIDPSGNATWVLADAAAADGNIAWDSHNSAPALSNDQNTLYVPVKSANANSSYSYLLGLDATTLATKYKVLLKDPRNGNGAVILDDSTASPMVAPDNDVYFGIFSNPDNGSRGFLLRFSGDLTIEKTPGAFGWDFTPAIVPVTMVTSYTGPSSYLIFSKYNNYANTGDGDGVNRFALLDPNAVQTDAHPSANHLVEMREVFTVIGVTPDPENLSSTFPTAVREWCINTPAVNPATHSIFTPSEDGHIYRWNLDTNSLAQTITLGSGVGEPYVPTIIGPDGTVYTLNGGSVFALGSVAGTGMTVSSSIPDLRTAVAGQSITFTAAVTNTGSPAPGPTGTVSFQDTTFQGLTPVTSVLASNVPVDSGGHASFASSALAAGTHFIAASYSGDSHFSSSTSTMVQRIHGTASSTVLGAAPNPSAPGQSVVFTATISSSPAGSGTPTGMVTFQEGNNVLAQVPLSSGSASFSTSALSGGNHTVLATYASDSAFAASNGSVVATVQVPPPSVASVSPINGSGSPQTFSATFSSPGGTADLSETDLLLNSSLNGTAACWVYYLPGSNTLRLINDAGSAPVPGSLNPGSAGSLSNGQCTVTNAGTVTISGNNLTLPLNVTFASGFAGSKKVYGYASSNEGLNSGWTFMGTWTGHAVSAPAVVSVNPINGSGSPQTFNATFSSTSGAADLAETDLLMNSSLNGTAACWVYYLPGSNSLRLINDAGTASVAGSINPGSAGSLSNSQCTVANAGAATVSGNNLTLPLTITFSSGFVGSKKVYGYAGSNGGLSSGWTLMGTWTGTAASPPAVVSVTPINGSGSPQTFSATFSSPYGTTDLSETDLLLNSSLNGAGACWVYYLPGSNSLRLINDAGTGSVPGSINPGSAGSLSNSQCTVENAGPATTSGNNLTLPLTVTFAPGFAGSQTVYGYAGSNEGLSSGWTRMGTWTGH